MGGLSNIAVGQVLIKSTFLLQALAGISVLVILSLRLGNLHFTIRISMNHRRHIRHGHELQVRYRCREKSLRPAMAPHQGHRSSDFSHVS